MSEKIVLALITLFGGIITTVLAFFLRRIEKKIDSSASEIKEERRKCKTTYICLS